MSWEGREQVWGACGYYREVPLSGYEEHPVGCECGGEVLFSNTVNDTNGDARGYIIPDLLQKEPHTLQRWRTVPDENTPRMEWDIDPETGDGKWVPYKPDLV